MSPESGEIVWQYYAPDPKSFFAGSRGAAQLLPNRNVLITDSVKGRVFEVTPEGETVWEFWNPDFRADRKVRATIFRMTRIPLQRALELDFPEEVKARIHSSITSQ